MKRFTILAAFLLALCAPALAQQPANRVRYGPTTAGVKCNPATGDVFALSVPPYTHFHCTALDTWTPDGITEHGVLSGLSDDDHPQYFNVTRGDARYYTQAALDALFSGKANTSHTHAVADTTGLQAALDAKASAADLTAEASARAGADTTLQANIDAEAASRAALTASMTANALPKWGGTNFIPARVTDDGTYLRFGQSDLGGATGTFYSAVNPATDTTSLHLFTALNQSGKRGLFGQSVWTNAAAPAGALSGGKFVLETRHTSGSLSFGYALLAESAANGAGTTDHLHGISVTGIGANSASVTNYYGIRVNAPAFLSGANITGKVAGIQIEDHSYRSWTAPNVYNLYSKGATSTNLFEGTVQAGALVGPGSGVTGLNASSLASGIVPSARLALTAADIPLLTSAKISDFNSAADARISAAVGVSAQAQDAELSAFAGLTSAADKLPYFTGSGTASTTDFSSFGRSLVDDADASAARSTLGLGTMAAQAEANYALLAGRAGGQTLSGGNAASESLTLQSTNHATKGYILLGTGGLVGVNKSTPGAQLHVQSAAAGTKGLIVQMAASPSANPVEVQDSTGTSVLSLTTAGSLTLLGNLRIGASQPFSVNGTSIIRFPSAGVFKFNNWNEDGSVVSLQLHSDTSVNRGGANIVQIGDGGANANGTLKVKSAILGTTTAKGACDSTARGTLYTEFGGAGVADKIYQCLKNASDVYAWALILSAP